MDIEKISLLKEQGFSLQDIANQVGISKTSAQRVLKNLEVKNQTRSSIHHHVDMGTSRYPREGEDRENFQRSSEERPVDVVDDRRGCLWIDPEKVPDGYVYGWITTLWNEKPKPGILMDAMKRGWVLVKTAEFYKFNRDVDMRNVLQDVFKKTSADYVEEGGLILMKRRLTLQEKEDREYDAIQQDRKDVGKATGMQTEDKVQYGPMDNDLLEAARIRKLQSSPTAYY